MTLQGKVAIVTGAGAGIGQAIALHFASHGAAIAVADVDPTGLAETERLLADSSVPALALAADVGCTSDTERIASAALERFGAIHILVNNAATTRLQKPVQEMTVDEWDECLNVSLRSAFLLAKWTGPHIRDSGGGSIVNISSVGAITPWAGGAAYCAAKNGLLALTKILAAEYAAWNIRVNAITPGAIMTPNLQASIERNHHLDRLCARTLLGRVGEAPEIANAALFLVSDQSSYITGTNLVVDGGWLSK